MQFIGAPRTPSVLPAGATPASGGGAGGAAGGGALGKGALRSGATCDLSMYRDAPEGDISVEEFERFALDRLRS
jgi:hypothetical protein